MGNMKTSKVHLGFSLTTALAAATFMGAGVANAASPDVLGQKYSDAQSSLSGAGYSVVVSTTFGDSTDRADCLVVNQVDRTVPAPENTSASPTNQTLVSLNCGAAVASAKDSGPSLASPEGRAAKAAEVAAAAKAQAQASAKSS
jgi:hypothetical protein